jgi:hypothetical protein
MERGEGGGAGGVETKEMDNTAPATIVIGAEDVGADPKVDCV